MFISPRHQRYFMTSRDQPLPLYIESLGYNGNQEKVSRPVGYPCYHWLQTVKGAGEFKFAGSTVILGKHQVFCCHRMNRMNMCAPKESGRPFILHLAVPSVRQSWSHLGWVKRRSISGSRAVRSTITARKC